MTNTSTFSSSPLSIRIPSGKLKIQTLQPHLRAIKPEPQECDPARQALEKHWLYWKQLEVVFFFFWFKPGFKFSLSAYRHTSLTSDFPLFQPGSSALKSPVRCFLDEMTPWAGKPYKCSTVDPRMRELGHSYFLPRWKAIQLCRTKNSQWSPRRREVKTRLWKWKWRWSHSVVSDSLWPREL